MRVFFLPRAALLLVLAATPLVADETRPDPPVTGQPVPELAVFDRVIPELMKDWGIPGGAVGVAKDGRLVFARGYGLADVEAGEPVQPDALFRIASISKPITAAVVLKLVEQGKMALDDPVMKWLDAYHPLPGQNVDPRMEKVTIEQLLTHTGGFDRGKSFDPMTGGRPLVEAIGPTANQRAIIEFMLGRPLDFDPGERYAYSNYGYCLLGRAIEQATGQPYDAAARSLVLAPAGARRMRLAGTRLADRAAGEVRYYPFEGQRPVRSIFADDKEPVPAPYGECFIDAMDAHGGWIASTVDLLRFTTALDGARKPAILKPETVRRIETHRVKRPGGTSYGLGWAIASAKGGESWSHNGSLPGTATMLLRNPDGVTATVLFNARPKDDGEFFPKLETAVRKALAGVKAWPERDLFPEFD
ncbi:MAG: beta-lactamase family protein [Pirellulales bacterium]|nr:beta-lactamase family protein [Pirellulales bacterium]